MSDLINGSVTVQLTSGEICLLNCVHDARNELRELEERWDNRLTFENLSFVEKYRVGRLSVALYLNISGHTCKVQYSALANHQSAVGKSHRPDFGVDVCQSSDGNRRNQQPVLVDYVETVQSTEGAIPSVVIGFYDIKQDGDDVGTRNLYFSPVNSCFKFLPCISEGEIRVTRWRSTRHRNDLTSHEIQGRAQVMDHVTDNQGNFTGKRLGHFELNEATARILLFLDVKTAKVSFDECGEYPIELVDMLFGPFDL